MRAWKIYLLHQTHFDIGYTHPQEEVFQIQIQNLEKAITLIEENKLRPAEAMFRWNPETTFPVMKWLEQATPHARERFTEMVKDGYIGLDGLFAGMLTGLCRPEELAQVFSQKKQLENLTGLPIDSAMVTDIPGWNWGLVSALSENGIRYLSSGPNVGDRIGYTLREWGDKPFYWLSPSGKERVLLWVHGKGYSWFHTGSNDAGRMRNKLTPGRMRRYLRQLERAGYPYDSVIIRYAIGADNGPPDENLSRIVEEWNENVDDIQLIISTTSHAMAEFERSYGDRLPTYHGDFTPYWEDGACSTARETAIAREASEHLIQAQALCSITRAEKQYDLETSAWENVLLFNEHTWGAYNSISHPDHQFVTRQWAWKRKRALQAAREATMLLSQAAGGMIETARFYMAELQQKKSDLFVAVYNTHGWAVSQIVELTSDCGQVFDAENRPVPSQRLASGRLAFYAEKIPPFGSREYRLEAGEPIAFAVTCGAVGFQLKNAHTTVTIDQKSGTIGNFQVDGFEYVSAKRKNHFNGYVLMPKKIIASKERENIRAGVTIEIVEAGPLIANIRIERKASRTLSYVSEISLNAYSNELRIDNTLVRPVSRRKEGIHFSYPFQIPNGKVRYDCAWGTVELDADQLPGANRNFITASRWVDISDENVGVCCILLDAPIFKSGTLIRDPWRWGPPKQCGWLKRSNFNGEIHSYVMNNFWQTNYKADQPGETLFRYVFSPHSRYLSAENEKAALEKAQPLVLAYGKRVHDEALPLTTNEAVVISPVEVCGGKLLARLFNASAATAETTLVINNVTLSSKKIEVMGSGKQGNLIGNSFRLAASETMLVSITL